MSVRDDMHDEATNNSDPETAGANLWTSYGLAACQEAVNRKKLSCSFSLGGSTDFRNAFAEAAEADGFTVTPAPPLVLINDFTVSW